MWRVRVDRRDWSIVAESPPDDVAWLEIESETMIRIWSASFRIPIGWYERAWLHDSGWIRDPRFAGVRTVLRELIIATPALPRVAVIRLLANLESRGAIAPVQVSAGAPIQ